ncbi:MAG: carbon starvation protein A [Nitriliruptorales bacterium]|nr:carbon starvation protein A [Nitriliruptorales bacterium]
MPGIIVLVGVLVLYALGYRFYSRYLADRVYALDPDFVVPSREFEDGVDYVPTNKHVLFGHHFTSIAGAAPIVGPAIAVFWGWGPALAWVVLGTIFAAGVHDFGALVVSVRNKAQSIGTLTSEVINARARTLFLLIIFFLLTLVNAVFAVVIAILFETNPGAVIPIFLEIPLAIGIGRYIYRTRSGALVPSLIGVALLYVMIPVGQAFPISLDGVAGTLGTTPRVLWVLIMFTYAFIACRLPVWVLLQPRDYINSHQLFIALAVIFLGLSIGLDRIDAPFVRTAVPEGSPSWFPFLFVTIACGAISGFHSLVSSGTTAKQLASEPDARYVGYMGAIGEGSLALGAILAVSAGLSQSLGDWEGLYPDFGTAADGAVGNFVNGVAQFVNYLGVPLSTGAVFAAVVVVSFAATTMDTGVRLQRYVIEEIGQAAGVRVLQRNIWVSTSLAVIVPLGMALIPGGDDRGFTFGRLWTLFGTTNQLTAGLALAVVAVWVLMRRRNPLAVLVPLIFLLLMTSWALLLNLKTFIEQGDILLTVLDLVIFVLAMWLIVEAVGALRRARAVLQREREGTGVR